MCVCRTFLGNLAEGHKKQAPFEGTQPLGFSLAGPGHGTHGLCGLGFRVYGCASWGRGGKIGTTMVAFIGIMNMGLCSDLCAPLWLSVDYGISKPRP